MDNELNTQQSGIERKVERSAAYPAITIEQALAFTAEIYNNFRFSSVKRDDISSVIEGTHPRHIAAAGYYLLLDREGDQYKVTEHYKQIANPLNEKERISNLLISFEAPKFNKNLIEKFDGGEIPKELVVHLTRFFGITAEAAPTAAAVFVKNAMYCKVLDERNILCFKEAKVRFSNPDFKLEEAVFTGDDLTPKSSKTEPLTGAEITPPLKPLGQDPKLGTQPPLLLDELVNSDKVKIRLTGGKIAYLHHPFDLNSIDVAILEKEIEKLKLIVGAT